MNMFLEFHLIQNFAPSNLNRDDTGAPKDALFGGYRRARVSSQCFKRAIRFAAHDHALIEQKHQGVRTKKLKYLLEKALVDLGHNDPEARIGAALSAAGLKVKDDGKTEHLLFLGNAEVSRFARLIHESWDELGSVVPTAAGKDEKKAKKESKANLPSELVKQAKILLTGERPRTSHSLDVCWLIFPR